MNLDPIVKSRRSTGLIAQGDAASACEAADAFSTVVLCAEEFQPDRRLIVRANSPTRVVYAPNDDDTLTSSQIQIAQKAARRVARTYAGGGSALVTCMQGRNRSGLVTALAICMLYGCSGRRAALVVQQRRRGAPALTNPNFVEYLNRIPPFR